MALTDGDQILGEVDVSNISPTGKTLHTVSGVPVTKAVTLRMVQLESDDSIYLIHYATDDAELTDTCHESVEDALEQAKFEYGLEKSDWTFFIMS